MSGSKAPFWRLLVVVVVIVVLTVAIIVITRTGSAKVGVIQPFQHIAVSDVTQGILDGLNDYDNTLTVLVENANGDNKEVGKITAIYQDKNVEIYVPIFTKTSEIVVSNVHDKAVVFAAVTDPVGANLLENPTSPESNVTGVSDLWPIGVNLELIREILPEAKTIGVVYDPGDPSSAATMPILKRESSARKFQLVLRPVTSAQEILQSLSSFPEDVDVIFTANDVTVTASLAALVAFAIEHQVPLFAADYSSVQRGAIAAVGQNYYNVGREAAEMVISLIEGSEIANLPVRYTTGGDLHINALAAEKMGVVISESLVTRAKATYQEIAGE